MPQQRVQIIGCTREFVQVRPVTSGCSACRNQCLLSQKLFSEPEFSVPNVWNSQKSLLCHDAPLPQEAHVSVTAPVLLHMALRCYALPLLALLAGSLGAELADGSDAMCAIVGFVSLFACQVWTARRVMHPKQPYALHKATL